LGGRVVYTVGHSTRSLEELLRILEGLGARVVFDVRRWPRSRRFPWFNRESLEAELARRGVRYVWLGEELGGRRSGDGPGSCIRSKGFRAYATYLASSREAQRAIEAIEEEASRGPGVVVLCTERLPWRCHRWILADWLVLRGSRVVHVIDLGRSVEHRPAPCARLEGGVVVYE